MNQLKALRELAVKVEAGEKLIGKLAMKSGFTKFRSEWLETALVYRSDDRPIVIEIIRAKIAELETQ